MTWTILHDACQYRNVNQVVARCQSHPEEAQERDDHESTPLHIAAFHNLPLEGMRAILTANIHSEQDIHGDTPLHVAVSTTTTTLEMVQLLVQACPRALSVSNGEGLQPLHSACRYNPSKDGIISLLVEAFPKAAEHRIKVSPVDTVSTRFDGDEHKWYHNNTHRVFHVFN